MPCARRVVLAPPVGRYQCAVEWHPGFRVVLAALDPDYRGSEFVELAQSLGGELTPATIGAAAPSGEHDLQALKRVWHLLARFGRR